MKFTITNSAKQLFITYMKTHEVARKHEEKCSGISLKEKDLKNNISCIMNPCY